MAFGKPTEIKRIKNAVLEDKLWSTYLETEDKNSQNWKGKWSWLLDEYSDLQSKLRELSKSSAFLSNVEGIVKEEDKRSIKPIPETTNHEYGWIPNKPEFQYTRFGPDVAHPMPLPTKYQLIHD